MNHEVLADYQCKVGEGCLWHAGEKAVLWTDIPNGRLFRYDPATGKHAKFYDDRPVGGFTIQADGGLLLFRDKGNIVEFKNGKVTRTLIKSLPKEEKDNRFNDVSADPEGRVFCGTGGDGPLGRLYRLDRDGSITELLDGIGCSNGMGWSNDLKTMYYTDSMAFTIYKFDYNTKTGAITKQRPFVKVDKSYGFPDGMCVDSQDNVWSAFWDGNCTRQFSPAGKELAKIELPVKKVACVTFGGADYSDMYLATAGGDDKEANGKHAGALFRVRAPGVKGKAEFLSRVGL